MEVWHANSKYTTRQFRSVFQLSEGAILNGVTISDYVRNTRLLLVNVNLFSLSFFCSLCLLFSRNLGLLGLFVNKDKGDLFGLVLFQNLLDLFVFGDILSLVDEELKFLVEFSFGCLEDILDSG